MQILRNPLLIRSLLFVILSFSIYSCKKNNIPYFKGEVVEFEKFGKEIKLPSQRVILEDLYDGRILSCDSFLIFKSYKYDDYWFYVFNVKTGEHIVSFCPKGDGPDDFSSCEESVQVIDENGVKKIWVRDNVKNARLINITRSIAEHTTVCDSIVPISWQRFFQFPPIDLFFLGNGQMALINQCEKEFIQEDEYKPRKLYLFRDSLNNNEKEYQLFNKPVICNNKKINFPYFLFYASCNRIKPDCKKVVMAMRMIGQISILDLDTGFQKGYRLKNSLTYENIVENIEQSRVYYTNVYVSDKYIYALYVDVSMKDNNPPYGTHTIHIFDWNGTPVYKLTTKEKIYSIALDVAKNILYAVGDEQEIYLYDVSNL